MSQLKSIILIKWLKKFFASQSLVWRLCHENHQEEEFNTEEHWIIERLRQEGLSVFKYNFLYLQ